MSKQPLAPDISAYPAVLFDMDGVIMDSMDYHTLAWQEVFRSLGKEISREFILRNEGSGEVGLWMEKLFAQTVRPDTPQYLEAMEYMRSLGRRQRTIFLAKYKDRVAPYPAAWRILPALKKRGISIALVTSSSRITMESIVPAALLACLQASVCAEDVQIHKPRPEPYLAAAVKLNVRADECLIVENSPGGIASAKAANAACAAVASTLSADYLHAADQIFASLQELADYFGL